MELLRWNVDGYSSEQVPSLTRRTSHFRGGKPAAETLRIVGQATPALRPWS